VNGEHWESNKDRIGNTILFISQVESLQFNSTKQTMIFVRIEPYVLMFRRLLKYRHESISECDDKNIQFPTVCIPRSATANQQQRPLSDSTNSSLNESGFESH